MHRWPRLLSLASASVVFGCWTLAFWFALALGRGWAVALPLGIILATGALWFLRDERQPSPIVRRDDAVAVWVVLALVALWPLLFDLGRTAIAVIIIGLAVLRAGLVLPADNRTADRRLLLFLLVGGAVTVGAALGWWVAALLVGGIGLCIAVWPDVISRPIDPAGESPFNQIDTPAANLGLAVLGVWLAIFNQGFAPFWAADNTYYINKAAHYAAHPRRFGVRDYLYGVDDVTHTPYGNILSSFEPMVGVVARLLGQSAFSTIFVVVVPLSAAAVPFAVRFAARSLGVARPNVAGAVGAAVAALAMPSLWAEASYGKTIASMVCAPILLGVLAQLASQPTRRRALIGVLTVVGFVGLSPSMALTALVVVPCFTAAAIATTVRGAAGRPNATSVSLLALPTVAILAFGAFGAWFQGRAGDSQFTAGFRDFAGPREAWHFAYQSAESNIGVFLILGATATLALSAATPTSRRALGLFTAVLFLVLFSPWGFAPLVDDVLDLRRFAWRLLWVAPPVVLVGIFAASIDLRPRANVLTTAAVVLAIGLASPTISDGPLVFFRPQSFEVWSTPNVWPTDAGAPAFSIDAANTIIAATPPEGRLLAPPAIEQVAAALQIDRFPTYGRLHYMQILAADPTTPPAFHADDRVLLARVASNQIAESVTPEQIVNALNTVEVDTVCLLPSVAEIVADALRSNFTAKGSIGVCELWTRRLE